MRNYLLALLLCLLPLTSSASTDARTTTFTSGTTGVTFGTGNASSFPWTCTVSGITEPIFETRVILTGFTHTNTQNLDMCLVAPNGAKIMLMSDAGTDFTSPGITNQTMTFGDIQALRAYWASFGSGSGAGGSFHPFNLDTTDDSFGSPFPGAPYTGPFSNRLQDGTNGGVNGTWSLYIMNDTAAGGSTTVCTANQFQMQFATIRSDFTPGTFYVSTGGLNANTGLTPSSPWPLQYAMTNRGYCTGDKILLLPGTYTGINNLNLAGIGVVAGGTNTFAWRPIAFTTNNALQGQGWIELAPYQYGRVIIDCRSFNANQGPLYIHDIEFTDSTVATRNAGDINRLTLDFTMAAWESRVDHCFFTLVGTAPGSCNYAVGNVSMYQGQEYHEHGVYSQSTAPNTYPPFFMNNAFMYPGGSSIKLIDGAYNFTVASNITINSGRSTAVNGYAIHFWHNPSGGYYEASPPKVFKNYFVDDVTGSSAVEDFMVGLSIGVGSTYNGGKDGSQIQFFNNYMLTPDINTLEIGSSASTGYLYNSIIKSNTLASKSNVKNAVQSRNASYDATADWDYNTYISDGASGNFWFQYNSSGIQTSLSAWTNLTVGGPAGKWDINSTLTFSDTTFGGDRWEVYADPMTTGRGHLIAINNTAQASHNFDLTPLGLPDGRKFTLLYLQSLTTQSTWQTNTFVSASPNLSITLTAVAWPKATPPTTPQTPAEGLPPDSLPRIGAWLVVPAPSSPTPTQTTNVGRTTMNLSWTLPSDAFGVRVYMRSNSSAFRALQTVDVTTGTTLAVPINGAQTNEFALASYNAYAENALGTAGTDPISLSASTSNPTIFRSIYNLFFRVLTAPK